MVYVGILGAGNISETHARAVHETDGVAVSAIYGQNHEKAVRLAQRFGGKVCANLDEFLDHRPLDVVMVGSPSGVHAEQGIAAARRGLHLLVEKPLDINTQHADVLISECAKAGVKLGVCFQDRVAPDIKRLKDFVAKGTLGKPILISARVKWYRPPEYYSASRWRGTLRLDGGGALVNQGVHTIDLLLWLMGDVVRVSAMSRTARHSIEAEDTLVATLEFLNGAIGTFEASTAVYPGYPRRVELSGSEGTVILEHDRIVAADLRTACPELMGPQAEAPTGSAAAVVVADVESHKRLLVDFLGAVGTDGRPCCDGNEGRRSLELVEAIYESARTRKPISL